MRIIRTNDNTDITSLSSHFNAQPAGDELRAIVTEAIKLSEADIVSIKEYIQELRSNGNWLRLVDCIYHARALYPQHFSEIELLISDIIELEHVMSEMTLTEALALPQWLPMLAFMPERTRLYITQRWPDFRVGILVYKTIETIDIYHIINFRALYNEEMPVEWKRLLASMDADLHSDGMFESEVVMGAALGKIAGGNITPTLVRDQFIDQFMDTINQFRDTSNDWNDFLKHAWYLYLCSVEAVDFNDGKLHIIEHGVDNSSDPLPEGLILPNNL